MVPPSEALDWDVQHEIGSTSRYWMSDRQAWWIAAPYLATAQQILARFEPRPAPARLRFTSVHLPPQIRARLLALRAWGGSLRSVLYRA